MSRCQRDVAEWLARVPAAMAGQVKRLIVSQIGRSVLSQMSLWQP